jgi:hypothetical protein
MSGLFGKRPKMDKPIPPSPAPTDVRTTEVRKNIYAELAKRRRASVLNQLTEQPNILRRTLGGGV